VAGAAGVHLLLHGLTVDVVNLFWDWLDEHRLFLIGR
jgi:hypothetical protein